MAVFLPQRDNRIVSGVVMRLVKFALPLLFVAGLALLGARSCDHPRARGAPGPVARWEGW